MPMPVPVDHCEEGFNVCFFMAIVLSLFKMFSFKVAFIGMCKMIPAETYIDSL